MRSERDNKKDALQVRPFSVAIFSIDYVLVICVV